MDVLRARAGACLAAGQRGVVVEVSAARGSAPRGRGTRMLVTAERCFGTIGGGHLELQAIGIARSLLHHPDDPGPRSRHFPLGPALGQCCGGAVTLCFERLDGAVLGRWTEAPPRFHLQLYGAGHVGRAVVRALQPLHVVVHWIDEREAQFPAGFMGLEDVAANVATIANATADPHATDAAEAVNAPVADGRAARVRAVCVDAVEAEVREAPPGAFYLVMTHRHDLDLRITEAILRRADFGFLGLIGSKTKRARFVHQLAARGVSMDAIARITCPIGLPGIAGKEPEVIAAAVVAQLLGASSASPHASD